MKGGTTNHEVVRLRRDANGDGVLDGCPFVPDRTQGPPAWGCEVDRARDAARSLLLHFLSERAAGEAYFVDRFLKERLRTLPYTGGEFRFDAARRWARRAAAKRVAHAEWRRNPLFLPIRLVADAAGTLAELGQIGVAAIGLLVVACVVFPLTALGVFTVFFVAPGALAATAIFVAVGALKAKGYNDLGWMEALALGRASVSASLGRSGGWNPFGPLARLPRREEFGATPACDDTLLFESLLEAMKIQAASERRHRAEQRGEAAYEEASAEEE